MGKVRLIEISQIDVNPVNAMLDEYAQHGEECKPMDFFPDKNTELYVIMDGPAVIGMIRKTSALYRECHGKFGITIRPAQRGKGYGSEAIRQVMAEWEWEPTACVEKSNSISIRMFEHAGWVKTGREFDWKGNRKAIEFVPKMQCNS